MELHSQQDPKPNEETPIKDLLIQDIKELSEDGKKAYGTYLQANNGRQPLVDLYEELIDACLYLRQYIAEHGEHCKK